MDENIKVNSVQNAGIKIDKDSLQNIASNLLKSKSSLDLGSLMQLATTFLKNDSLMKSVTDLSKNKQNRSQHETKTTANQEKLANDISVQNTGNNVDKSSLDINSMMQLATTLLKNDSLMNSVTEMSKNKQNTSLPESKSTKKLEKVTNDNSVRNTGKNVDKSPLDMNSMIQLATTLLKNDSLMNSVTEMSKNKQNTSLSKSKSSKKRKKVKENNSVNNSGKKVDKDSLDLNSLMHLATSLTKNETLMNSVTELSNKNLNGTLPESKVSKHQENIELTSLFKKLENITKDISGLRQENAELSSLSQKIENFANEFSELKQELKEVKEQNNNLIKLLIQNNIKTKKK